MTPSEGNVAMGDRIPSIELLREDLAYAQAMVAEAEMNSEVRRKRLLEEWRPRVAALKQQIAELEEQAK